MIVYIGDSNVNGTKYRQFNGEVAFMFTPFSYRTSWTGRYVLDNGAFSAYVNGLCFDSGAFLKALNAVGQGADFITVPDIVAEGKRSFEFSKLWLDFLGYPYSVYTCYFAVQNGMKPEWFVDGPLQGMAGVFVGGTMEWKLRNAQAWIDWAHTWHVKVHIGRIGTLKGLMWAKRIGADSVDSSNFAQNPRNLRELIQWAKGSQEVLELTEAE